MTGRPSYTFRDAESAPECRECGEEMVFLEEQGGVFNERDVYGCSECGGTVEDRWTF
ncbi:MAG: hypothetical protein SVW77_00395 [Candidatus Nanohaloarchaea archaeon]|nr:hypothetical protein [Candidatus Nanohaloarchaea archaeon]